VDTTVRAVTFAITRPVQLVAGFAQGVTSGFASLRTRKDPRRAFATGRDAAKRREQEIADELRGGGSGPER
jgi:hypothetical protein